MCVKTTDPWVAYQTLQLAHLSGQSWLVWSSLWVVTVNVTNFSRISQMLSPQDRQGNSNFSFKKVNFQFTSNNNQRRLGPQSLCFSFSLSLPPHLGDRMERVGNYCEQVPQALTSLLP